MAMTAMSNEDLDLCNHLLLLELCVLCVDAVTAASTGVLLEEWCIASIASANAVDWHCLCNCHWFLLPFCWWIVATLFGDGLD